MGVSWTNRHVSYANSVCTVSDSMSRTYERISVSQRETRVRLTARNFRCFRVQSRDDIAFVVDRRETVLFILTDVYFHVTLSRVVNLSTVWKLRCYRFKRNSTINEMQLEVWIKNLIKSSWTTIVSDLLHLYSVIEVSLFSFFFSFGLYFLFLGPFI